MRVRGLAAVALIALCAPALLSATPVRALDLNAFRAQHGLPRLASSGALAAKARAHAADMARRRSMDHAGFHERMRGHRAAAENVAAGCPSADCAYKMWAESSGHRANMLHASVTHYGLASAKGGDGMRYWVLELADMKRR